VHFVLALLVGLRLRGHTALGLSRSSLHRVFGEFVTLHEKAVIQYLGHVPQAGTMFRTYKSMDAALDEALHAGILGFTDLNFTSLKFEIDEAEAEIYLKGGLASPEPTTALHLLQDLFRDAYVTACTV
jgi:hypothetical protein